MPVLFVPNVAPVMRGMNGWAWHMVFGYALRSKKCNKEYEHAKPCYQGGSSRRNDGFWTGTSLILTEICSNHP
jgi:hypothetical protein